MSKIRRQHSAEFKTHVVMELLEEEETLSQVCSKFAIHPTQAKQWRQNALAQLKTSFTGKSQEEQMKEKDRIIDELYKQIGQLKVELDWIKKKMGYISP